MRLNRRHFLAGSAATFVMAPWRSLAGLAQPAASPATATSFEDVRRGVGIFNGRGGTIGYLVTNDGVVVVDTQFMDTARICAEGLQKKSTKPIVALLNTHHHGDHTGGNAVFKGVAKTIVAHKNAVDAQRQVAAQPPATPGAAPVEQVYADTTYETTWKLDVGGETVAMKYFGAGHTGGDSVVTFEKANVVHMGDLMFNRRHPFIDRPMGASVKNWAALLPKVVADHAADTLYVSGHAKDGLKVVVTAAELKAFAGYFGAVLDHVQAGVKAGRSKEEVTKLATLKGYDDYMEAPPRLTLSGVLAVAYDEVKAAS